MAYKEYHSLRSSGTPTSQWPLEETNAVRKSRSIRWKARPLDSISGRIAAKFSGAQHPLTNMHWGVQIGPYLYEVGKDIGGNGHLINMRWKAGQAGYWKSKKFPGKFIGTTTLTDREINAMSLNALDNMRSPESYDQQDGIYSYNRINCQRFAILFTGDLLEHPAAEGQFPEYWNGAEINTRMMYERTHEKDRTWKIWLAMALGSLPVLASLIRDAAQHGSSGPKARNNIKYQRS
ncbi:MAG: hypothetical protein Q9160_005126 [Pyrenula sp. 1 TL-2023]